MKLVLAVKLFYPQAALRQICIDRVIILVLYTTSKKSSCGECNVLGSAVITWASV